MNNFSQNIDDVDDVGEKTAEIPEPKKQDVGEIRFDETVDIDEIQKKLQETIDNGDLVDSSDEENLESEGSDSDDSEVDDYVIEPEVVVPVAAPVFAENEAEAKKYVIYIDAQNIEFMESLSINERREIINKILAEQNEAIQKIKKSEARDKFFRHVAIAVLTFIIGFPILFIGVNKAMEITMVNYKQAKENFGKLYKEQGKIKSINSGSIPRLNY